MRWVCTAVAVMAAGSASAAEFRSGQRIVINQGEVIDDDLYAFGQTVQIEGEVLGDVVAFGQQIEVPGRVGGDLISAARAIRIEGQVDGSLRTASGELSISGAVDKDAIAASGNVEVGQDAKVAGDVAVAAGAAQLVGSVGRNVMAATRRLLLDGNVGGEVRARTESFTVGDHAAVAGPVQYSAAEEAHISEQARLGNVERLPSERGRGGPAWFFFGWLRLSIGLFALGLLWRLLAPKLSREAPATLRAEPWKSLGLGALALLVAPFASALLFGLGLLLGGWWLALLLCAALLIAVSLAFPTVGLLAGQSLVARFGKARARLVATLAIGVVLLALLLRIPFLGALVALAAVLFGFGALLLASWHLRRAPLASPAPG